MNHKELDEYLINKLRINTNFDIVRGIIKNRFIVYYLSSLVDTSLIQLIYQLTNQTGYEGNIQKVNNLKEIETSILSGLLFVLPINDDEDYYLIETREYPTRGISEPETEQTIRGSKDGFCESIITNVGLIRRRIRDSNLVLEKYQLGKTSKSDVIICYLDNKVNKKYLNNLKNKLVNKVDLLDSVVMSDRAIEEVVFEQKFKLYPLVKYSERPDITSINILK